MNFSVIGTGNMAWFLASGLVKAGWNCSGIYGRNRQAAEALALVVAAPVLASVQSIPDVADHICFLAVSDQSIATVASECAFLHTLLVHTSGVSSIDLLAAAANRGVIWPVYSIIRGHLPEHRNVPLAYESDTAAAEMLIRKAVAALSVHYFEAGETQRRYLHLAAVFANNFTNHLMAVTEQLCLEHQLSFDDLKPILQQTFARVAQDSPKVLQSGPARRHDEQTMQLHLELLRSHPEWAAVYESLSASVKKMYDTP